MIKEPTTKQKNRFKRISELGCIACWLDGVPNVPCDIHHLLSGGRRLGHGFTVGICPFHHRGIIPEGRKPDEYQAVHGPSLALKPRAFRVRYGDEEELLAIQEALLDHYLDQIGVTQ